MVSRLVALALLGLVVACGATAVAGTNTVTLVDARRDVWLQPDARARPVAKAPSQTLGDVRRTTITHAASAVLIQMQFVELQPQTPNYMIAVRLRTDTLSRTALLLAGSLKAGGGVQGKATLHRRDGQITECALQHRVDWQGNAVHVRVPRTCLGQPRWIQASINSTVVVHGAPGFFYDNAHNSLRAQTEWTRRIRN